MLHVKLSTQPKKNCKSCCLNSYFGTWNRPLLKWWIERQIKIKICYKPDISHQQPIDSLPKSSITINGSTPNMKPILKWTSTIHYTIAYQSAFPFNSFIISNELTSKQLSSCIETLSWASVGEQCTRSRTIFLEGYKALYDYLVDYMDYQYNLSKSVLWNCTCFMCYAAFVWITEWITKSMIKDLVVFATNVHYMCFSYILLFSLLLRFIWLNQNKKNKILFLSKPSHILRNWQHFPFSKFGMHFQ